MSYYFYAFKTYWLSRMLKQSIADVNGRASRMEFWTFTLINFLIIGILCLLNIMSLPPGYYYVTIGPFSALIQLYIFLTVIPTFTVTVRRLQDSNRSWFYILCNLIPFFGSILVLGFACDESTKGSNHFGPDPLEKPVDSRNLQDTKVRP